MKGRSSVVTLCSTFYPFLPLSIEYRFKAPVSRGETPHFVCTIDKTSNLPSKLVCDWLFKYNLNSYDQPK